MYNKICFISLKSYQLFNPNIKSTFWGAEVQMSFLAKEFAKNKNLDVSCIVGDYWQEKIEKINDVKIYKTFQLNDSFLKKMGIFFSVFRKVNAQVYIQRTLTLQSWIIALYCKITRKKFVYMVAHDNETDGWHSLYKNIIWRFFIWMNYTFSHMIVVQNTYEYNKLIKFKDKLLILKKWVIHKQTSLQDKIYDGIWVGRCESFKQPEVFLELVSQKPNNNFLMISPCELWYEQYFQDIKQQAWKYKNLKFIDFATNEEIHTYLEQTKLFVFTSLQEGDWPMTILEACSKKLPILSYELNYDYLIDSYEWWMYCHKDKEKFSVWFDNLLENYVTYWEKSYQYVLENHNLERNSLKLLQSIEQI